MKTIHERLFKAVAGTTSVRLVMMSSHRTPLPAARRIVTGHDESGRAVVTEDGAVPTIVELASAPGTEFHELWSTCGTPASVANEPDPTRGTLLHLPPPKRGTRIRFVDIPPDTDSSSGATAEKLRQTFAELGHAAASTATTGTHPLMHRMETVDYAVVVQGAITLVLDDSEIDVQAGEVVIQRGTNHAWANRSGQTCRMLFVLIDGRYEPELARSLAARGVARH